ncbi:MAG: prolyl oligopeptidase family serine peptidase [Egibacteraceae bacterium]
MKRTSAYVAVVAMSAACSSAQHPPTRAEDIVENLHGVDVADPYRWLEAEESAEVQAWMKEQHAYARERLDALPGREALSGRLRELFYVDALSTPLRRGQRWFYERRHADREKAIVYWREGERGDARVLIDPNALSEDGSISLGTWVPSYDGQKVAYALKENNADEATLYVMDVATGQVSDVDRIEGAKYAEPSWTPDGDGFYYTYLPTDPSIPVADRSGFAEIRFHTLGTDPKGDPLVHERTGDPATFAGAWLSRDGHWLFYSVDHGWNATDVYYRDMRAGEEVWRPLVVGVDALFSVDAWADRFYVMTNDGAPRWRVLRIDPDSPDRAAWEELVPEADGAVLESAAIVGGHLALTYLRDAASELEIRTLDGEPVRRVPLPGLGSSAGLIGNPDEDEAYFSFSSFTRPGEIYRTSVRTGQTELWSKVELPVDPGPYTVEQVFYPSKDGTQVPMFLVHRRDLPRDGSTPFLLTGYGGFNISETPSFRSGLYAWLEAGGGYALANLRGGGEYGEEWHRAGMLGNKQNVFDDFVAAAEYLIANDYTRAERLAIRGGSNGGLLVGAALIQRPDLFAAVVCDVPLLDMVRYHLFGSGKTWIPEYGAADDEAAFGWLYAYSPYHHVKASTAYPAVLFRSADSDDRVDPMHARKMAAALQSASASGRPVLLSIEANAGHGGADLVSKAVEEGTDVYAFLMHELGVTPPDG